MNAAMPAPGARLAALDDVPDGGAIVRDFSSGEARFSLLLARRGDVAFAYENRCPHAGYPLERLDGSVLVQERLYIVCVAHGASFVLDTGACAGGPCNRDPLTQIPIETRDGSVFMRALLPPRRHPALDHDGGA